MMRYHEIMKKRNDRRSKAPGRVAEPVQVYLAPSDRDRLERLASKLGATKSDVLRQGLLALESQAKRATAGRRAVPLPTFRGEGLQPGVDLDDSAALLDLMDADDATR
jgi:hypothetical protein